MSNYAPKRTSYDTGDRRWLVDLLKAETHGVTIDGTLAGAGTIKSGTVIAVRTSDKFAGKYATGGTGGLDVADGHLLNDLVVEAGQQYHVAVVHAGTVKRSLLPTGHLLDTAAENDLTTIAYLA